jgi:hypothetical protein
MQRKSLNLLLLAIPISALAACGSSGDNTAPPPSPPPTTVVQEDTFGVAFGTAFRADASGTPIEPKDGDIIPLTLTAEPTDVK